MSTTPAGLYPEFWGRRAHPGRCLVVAEISNAHNGSEQRAAKLVAEAAEAGADLVKFQAYTPQELVDLRGEGPAPEPWASQGHTMRSLYQQARTPLEWLPGLFQFARECGVGPFASTFGLESLEFVQELDPVAYKVASLDRTRTGHVAMIQDAAAVGKVPLVVSSPSFNREWGSVGQRGVQLWCPEGYPQDMLHAMWPAFGADVQGFSYHGTDRLIPKQAVDGGAWMVEVHVQLAGAPSTLEANVCLTMDDLSELCRHAKRAHMRGALR